MNSQLTQQQREGTMATQLRFEEITEFENFLITEKIARVRLETQKGLDERPDDKNMVTYVKNAPRRIIEWIKNADMDWIRRERLERDNYWQPTEVVEFIDLKQIDRECPSKNEFRNQQEQSLETKFPSDRAIFAECVVGKNGQILAPHLKIEEPEIFWNKKEFLMEETGLSEKLCIRLKDAFATLRFNRNTILEILKDIDEPYICYLEALIEDLEDMPLMHYDPKLYSDHGILETDLYINSISQGTLADAFPAEHIEKLKYIIEEELEPEEKAGSNASPFGYHKIYHQEDGCSHEFLSFLKEATKPEIRGIMQNFFPRKGPNGELYRPVFWYLTGSQRAQAWIYINERRIELGMIQEQSEIIDFAAKK